MTSTTSPELFQLIASTTGQLFMDSMPLVYLILGFLIAFLAILIFWTGVKLLTAALH